MIFNLIIFVLFGVVAYFHYVQGLFSAAISAICCIFAAVLAVGYEELLASYMMGKVPDQADAIAIVGIFVVAYVLMRILFDQLVPGNVRFPILMDKIGSAVAGIFAGLFSTGVLAIAAQALPFGTTIGGFSRQELGMDRPVSINGSEAGLGRSLDAVVTDEVLGDRLGDPTRAASLWFNQDGMVVGLTTRLGEAGSLLDNGHPFESAHPAFLTELYGQRLGVPIGAKHILSGGVSTSDPFILTKPVVLDAEIKDIRGGELAVPGLALLDQNQSPLPTTLVVVPVSFGGTDAGDSDGFLRLSPGGVRLKTGNTDYYPIGTLVGSRLLLENRLDDPLIIPAKDNPTVDFVFTVLTDDLNANNDNHTRKLSLKDGSFLDVKGHAMADLSGRELKDKAPDASVNLKEFADDGVLGGVVRKRTTGLMKLVGNLPQSSRNGSVNPALPGHGTNMDDLNPDQVPTRMLGF
jgi:hypothetical protein